MKWIFCLLCSPAWGQSLVSAGGDTIELRPSDRAGIEAELYYSNSGGMRSLAGRYTVELNGLKVRVHLSVTGEDEHITVFVEDDGLFPIPAEADVPDGGAVTIEIQRPMF